MTRQEPGDRTFVDLWPIWASNARLITPCCGNFPALSSDEKGGEERLLFFPTHRLPAATSFAWGLDGAHSQAINW